MTDRQKQDEKELSTKCPLCSKKGVRAFRPFCSKRCKDVDLGNWLTGLYVIPGEADQDRYNHDNETNPDADGDTNDHS